MNNINSKMCNEIMNVMREYSLEDKLSSESQSVADDGVNEFLSVLIATSSRVSAAYLMNKIRNSETVDSVEEAAGNMISMVAYNYELALAAELNLMIQKIDAMTEKQLSGGNKTSH